MACSSVNYSYLSHQSLLLRPQFHLACTTLLLRLSRLSITYSFVIVALELWCVTQWILLPKQLYLQMLIEMSHWSDQGLWLLLHNRYWTFTETTLGYPAVVLSHGHLVYMVPQDHPLHMLQQFVNGEDVRSRWDQLNLGLGGS